MNIVSKDLTIIAEIGVNHEGSLHKALELIRLAAEANADVVKFQSYTPERFIAAHDSTRLERVRKFSLNEQDHMQLFDQAKSLKVDFMSTPVTEDWIEFLNPYVKAFKIASGDITFKPVIQKAARTGKPLIISTGASTLAEIDQAVEWVKEEVGETLLKERLILMHCVSAYPAPIEEANILSIPFLKERYGLRVGYSNHVMGLSACLAAVALGAQVIEVHFTDCKEGRDFRDHVLSFDQNDLKTFVQMAREVRKSLGTYGKSVQESEKHGIPLMRKGIIASRPLQKGHTLTRDDLLYARPATEYSSNQIENLIGKEITEDIDSHHLIPRSAIKCVV